MPFDIREPEFGVDGGIDDRDMDAIGAPNPAGASDQGPCLYLGPAGQRCSRSAVKGGFCALHQPGAVLRKISKPSKLLAAIAGIVGVLWPYVYDFVHELIRWIHPR
jgi:hypothetical protein